MLCRQQITVVLLAVVAAGHAETLAAGLPITKIFVSPDGNDAHSGKLAKVSAEGTDGPLASLVAARDAVRKLRTGGQLPGPVRVIVAGGTYSIDEPLLLTPEDSGTASTPISYEAAEGTEPVISGGRVIGGWTKGDDGIWTTKLGDVAAGHWYFEQLFVNGRRATRAREPNEFYYYMQDIHEEVLEEGGRVPKRARQTIYLARDDFDGTLGRLSPEELRDTQIQIYHKWDNTWRFVGQVDREEAAIVTEGRGMMPWNNWRRNTRFHLENFRAALDSPGEWFLAHNGTLFYRPLPGEEMSKAEVVAPVAEKFVVVAGDSAKGKFVEHVTLRGLNFRHGQWLTPPGGFEGEQAASSLEAALQFDGAKNIAVENCEVGHIGIYAVWFRNACRHCSLRHCYLHDFGAGGARIGQRSMPATEAEHTSHVILDNNIIRQGGSIFPCAVGVWIGFSGDNHVTHNEIADLFYTGLSVGWNWGYGPSLAKRNDIGFNHVHHIGQGVLSDMGGIYTLGLSEGTRVHDNVFHDIYSYSYGGWGLYTDQASTGIVFENNLVYNTKTGGFHQHFGKENIVRNNILAFAELYQIQATRPEDHLSFTLENNVVYYDQGKLLSGSAWKKAKFGSQSNCFWNASGEPISFAGNTLEEWQEKGHELNSIIADPKFADPAAGDYALADDSPTLKLGFKPFDYTSAGVYGAEAWRRKASESTAPPLKVAPEPPPLTIRDDFERSKPGDAPAGELHVEGKGDSITVTDETAASGRQSLKMVDAEGLKTSWLPHYVVRGMNYVEGRACNSFDLRVDPSAYLSFEWRDYKTRSPYITGPKFTIRNGKLELPGGIKEDFPVGEWVKIEIVADMSETGGSKWALYVTFPDGNPRIWRNLPFANPGCYKVNWIGFMSNAQRKTAVYLDNFSVHP